MLSIRPATIDDVSSLATLICELAEYEKLSHEVGVTADDLARDGFGKNPKFSALIAESDSQIAGYAAFFPIYSTFHGRAGIFVEDVYVRPAFRGQGIGKALFARIAEICQSSGAAYMKWEVLDWNAPAIGFYRRMNATFLGSWKSAMLSGRALDELANRAAES